MTRDPLEWLLPLVAIPSISTDPAHAGDVRAAAELLCGYCSASGLRHVGLLEAAGAHPAVYADWLDAPGQPTVLLYGHYDVQPVIDPQAWTTPAFSPTIRDGSVFGRGASDMKGPLVAMLAALGSMLDDGPLPVNVRVLLEGEEEIFSPRLRAILQQHRTRLACDIAISADGTQPLEGTPHVMLGTRGLCDLELIVRGARTDTHSGQYGGAVPNPAQVLAELVAGMHDADGRVLVEGFYDGVREPTAEERERLGASGWSDGPEAESLGLRSLVGEPAWTGWERTTLRPTLELNAIHAGYAADQLMTAIPAMAHARISCRLVPAQRPEHVLDAIAEHVRRAAPGSVDVELIPGLACTPAFRTTRQQAAPSAVALVLAELYGSDPVDNVDGGTVAALALLQEELGLETATLGFAADDENAHGADEFHRITSLARGRDAYRRLLERLAT